MSSIYWLDMNCNIKIRQIIFNEHKKIIQCLRVQSYFSTTCWLKTAWSSSHGQRYWAASWNFAFPVLDACHDHSQYNNIKKKWYHIHLVSCEIREPFKLRHMAPSRCDVTSFMWCCSDLGLWFSRAAIQSGNRPTIFGNCSLMITPGRPFTP